MLTISHSCKTFHVVAEFQFELVNCISMLYLATSLWRELFTKLSEWYQFMVSTISLHLHPHFRVSQACLRVSFVPLHSSALTHARQHQCPIHLLRSSRTAFVEV